MGSDSIVPHNATLYSGRGVIDTQRRGGWFSTTLSLALPLELTYILTIGMMDRRHTHPLLAAAFRNGGERPEHEINDKTG